MGEVYLAEHSLLKRPCALKLIKPEAGSDPVAMARFEREVQSAARLAHPNTIEIFDYGLTGDGTFYYVMEYLQGQSLGDLVRSHGPLPAGRVIYLMRQVCAGLAEAHGMGLVHRDLKPAERLCCGARGRVGRVQGARLRASQAHRDPGAANLTSDMTVSGTPMFMAPEQTVGDRSLDARADIYALGAVMYHALTGQPPFVGENAFAIMMAHSRDPVVPPSQLNPDVPADLEQVVLRCLAKKPEDRYPSARALGQALAVVRRRLRVGSQPRGGLVGRRGFVRPAGRFSVGSGAGRGEDVTASCSNRRLQFWERTSMPTRPASRNGAALALLTIAACIAGSSGWVGFRPARSAEVARAGTAIARATARGQATAPAAAPPRQSAQREGNPSV